MRSLSFPSPRDQSGLSIVEGIVAGLILILAMTATFSVLQASGSAGADQRHRSQSYSIAQADQARLRSLRVTEVMGINQTRQVTEDGTPYTVTSTGQFVSDATGTVNCDTGTAAADYVKISSTVDWPSRGGTPPTRIESVISPPNGSFSADRGTLAVAVRNGQNMPVAGIPLSGSGAGTFSGTTGENGCALFPNQPEGTYTLNASTATGVVDRDGKAPGPVTVSVVGQSTNTVALQYDNPGSLKTTFKTRINGSVQTSKADSIVAFNTGMTKEQAFGTIGSEQSFLTATPLFPFSSADTVYAGSCAANNPNPSNLATLPAAQAGSLANVLITPGATANAQIQLPALSLTVRTGSSSSSQGSVVNNATVKITDTQCTTSTGGAIKRTYTNRVTPTPAGLIPSGQSTPDPGIPYGVYDICASNGSRRLTLTNVAVKTTNVDTVVPTIYLAASGSTTGQCP